MPDRSRPVHPRDAAAAGSPSRRVRDEVRAQMAVAATSVAASIGFVLVATLLMRLAG